MIDGVDYQNCWLNNDLYKRLQKKDLDNEGCIKLVEQIMADLKQDMDDILKQTRFATTGEERAAARERRETMLRFLRSDYFNGLSMGHGEDIASRFSARF